LRKRVYNSSETFDGVSVKPISKFNDHPFRVIEKRQIISDNGAQFLVTQSRFSAHGRIDIYSEGTADACSGADFSQLNIAQRDKSFSAHSGFHCNSAPHEPLANVSALSPA
jgi:hypothetical protein